MLNRRSILAAGLGAASAAACQNVSDAANAATWSAAAPMPYATQEIYPVLHSGAIWVAGGFSPQAGGATERVFVFDPARNTWSEGPALPTPSHHIQLVSLNGDLYGIGGFLGGPSRNQWICTPRVLKLEGDAWVETTPLPKPMAECVSIAHAGRIHLISGRSPRGAANANYGDHIDVADHFVFSLEAGWQSAAPLPMARNSAALASDGARFHVISGRTISGAATPAYDIYDPHADRWESGAPYPEPHGGIAAAFWRGQVLAGGGELLQQRRVSDAVYAINNGAWTQISTLPAARHGHGFVTAREALYAIGGSHQIATLEPLASVDMLR